LRPNQSLPGSRPEPHHGRPSEGFCPSVYSRDRLQSITFRTFGYANRIEEVTRTWNDYYADESRDTAIKDDRFFQLETEELVARIVTEATDRATARILELGSATGYVADIVMGAVPQGIATTYTGVDVSDVACERARARKLPGARFEADDFLSFLGSNENEYDIVVTQRSIMALLSRAEQTELLQGVRRCLSPGGTAVLSEGTQQALDRLNDLRAQAGVEPFARVWHSLYVDEQAIKDAFDHVEVHDFSSLYWLLTRVVYPSFEEPQHNSPFHSFAASLPQVGDFGLVKLFVGHVR
jgi:SAM-dependent methyltransferase